MTCCEAEAVAPNADVRPETSWAGCVEGEAVKGSFGPCEGACEDRDEADRRITGARYYFGRPKYQGTPNRIGVGSFVSPFADGYRTRLEPPLFPVGGCRRGW